MAGLCGTCTACCRVFSIAELKKPASRWCEHCDIGVGCKIYNDRPPTCIDFRCLWLHSHLANDGFEFPEELRPDKCKVVFSPSTKADVISATTLPGYPDAWKKPIVMKLIKFMTDKGLSIAAGSPGAMTITMINKAGTSLVHMTEPDENGVQWNIEKTVVYK